MVSGGTAPGKEGKLGKTACSQRYPSGLVPISRIFFNGIFKFNDNTKEIYRNRRFYVKKIKTIISLLKEFNKIEFDKYDVDVKGKAYELTLQIEGATNKDFSQFFTPRWIYKYMVSNADIKIEKDG